VIQDLWCGLHHGLQGIPITAEIRNQQLNRCRGRPLPDGVDAGDEMVGTTIGQIIAVDRRDHNVAQAHSIYRLTEAPRLGDIKGPDRAIKVDVAIGAGPGTPGAHDQERGRPTGKTFTDVGTTGLLANRVQLQIEQQIGYGPNALTLGGLNT
jgi:hypothetical protein